MRADIVEIPSIKWESQRKLALDKSTQVALAEHLRERWPTNTAKLAAREYGLSLDRARHAVNFAASLTTYDQIKKAGGWPVIFAVEARVIGQGADQFLIELRASHDEQASRLAAVTSDLWPVRGSRRDDPARLDSPEGERRVSERRREG